jgi:hypothetical protein
MMKRTACPAVPADDAAPFTPLGVHAEAWLERLPEPVRVHGVAAHMPQLANRLAADWNDAAGTASLLEGLLVENVRAMPVAIAVELLRLYEYHANGRASEAPSTTWELPACRVGEPVEVPA